MPIRRATNTDIPIMGQILAASWGPDILFRVLFPNQHTHPSDMVTAFRRQIREAWWDYSMLTMVSYEESSTTSTSTNKPDSEPVDEAEIPLLPLRSRQRETITGLIVWRREGRGWRDLWGIWGTWDPRLLIHRLVIWRRRLSYWLRPCRAATRPSPDDPTPLTWTNFGARLAPFTDSLVSDPAAPHRATRWSLEMLAVHPAYHGRGYGRELVESGMKRVDADADGEGLPVVVISAPGKEGFYQRFGFGEPVGYQTADMEGVEGRNPLKERGIDGGACMWRDPVGGFAG